MQNKVWTAGIRHWCPAEKFEDTSEAYNGIPPTLPVNSKSQSESDEKKVPKVEKNDGLIENRGRAHSFTYAPTLILLLACIQISFDGLQSVDDIGFMFSCVASHLSMQRLQDASSKWEMENLILQYLAGSWSVQLYFSPVGLSSSL